MRKLLQLLSTALVAVLAVACGEYVETRQPGQQSTGEPPGATSITYESDSSDCILVDDEADDSGARAATPKGKLLISYINNEGEVYRPSSYSVVFYRFETLTVSPTATMPELAEACAGRTAYTTLWKKTSRSYVRKTLRTGSYIATVPDSDLWYQFSVSEGSDGILQFNENSQNPNFSGYHTSYGKIKVSLWYGKTKVPDAHVTVATQPLSTKPPSSFSFWLYAEDGTTARKGMYWFLPANAYTVSHWANRLGGTGTFDTITLPDLIQIAPGKVYPHLKLAYN